MLFFQKDNPYDLDSIDKRVYIDSLEQYNKGIDVPFRNFKVS